MQHTSEHRESRPADALELHAHTPDPIEGVLTALEYALVHGEGANPLLIARTARRLGMSARTLQRRLRASGTSFSHLLRQLRERSACRLLCTGDQRLSEIAEQLGFSEHSAFSRAFKRWTGTSPCQFRCSCAVPDATSPSPSAVRARLSHNRGDLP